jgi:transcriptional regulator with XRE-family HTH domain
MTEENARLWLGARLRAEREARGWTIRRMAERIYDASAGLHNNLPDAESIIPQIRRWERGTSGIGERYRTLYCIAFGMGRDLFDKPPASARGAAVRSGAGTR